MEDNNKTDNRRKRKKRIRMIVGAVIAVPIGMIAALILIPCSRIVTASGYVTTEHHAQIRPSDEGPIGRILVQTGQRVKEGELVMELANPLETAQHRQSTARLKTLQATLRNVEMRHKIEKSRQAKQIREAELILRSRKNDYQRLTELGNKGIATQKELDDVRTQLELAQVQLAKQRLPYESLRAREIDVLKERIALAREEVNRSLAALEIRQVRAPLSGVAVLGVFAPGQVVDKKTILGEIFDPAVMLLKIRCPERHLFKLALDQPAQIELSTRPHRHFGYLKGRVVRIAPVVTPRISGDGYGLAWLRITSPPPDLRPGATGQADIDTGSTRLLWWLIGVD